MDEASVIFFSQNLCCCCWPRTAVLDPSTLQLIMKLEIRDLAGGNDTSFAHAVGDFVERTAICHGLSEFD
jgi:hypothetical protein